jgi:hypothetical protein
MDPVTYGIAKQLYPGAQLYNKDFVELSGFFVKFLQLPVNLAWDSFREANGVKTLQDTMGNVSPMTRATVVPHFMGLPLSGVSVNGPFGSKGVKEV